MFFGPKTVEEFFERAQQAWTKGDGKKAVDWLIRASRRFPKDAKIVEELGWLALGIGNHEVALRYADEIVKVDSSATARASYLRGEVFRSRAELTQAAQHYENAARLDPQRLATWVNLGVTLDDLGRSAEALTCYERALEIDPKQPDARGNVGNSLLNLGRPAEALKSFESALALGNPRGAIGRRKALLALGRIEAANEALPNGPGSSLGEAFEERAGDGERTLVARYFVASKSPFGAATREAVRTMIKVVVDGGPLTRLHDGYRLGLGWVVLTVRQRGGEYILCEPDWQRDPLTGITEEVSLSAQQMVKSNLLAAVTGLEPTECSCHAVVHVEATALQSRQIVMTRRASADASDSGWTIRRARDSAEPTTATPMARLMLKRSVVADVAHLPPGTEVLVVGDAVTGVRDESGQERYEDRPTPR